jgi:hypothetical protein
MITCRPPSSVMRVIHRVPDKFTTRSRQAHDTFTTKNRSQWISFNFVRDTFTTCSRLVRDSFTTDFYSRLVRMFSVDHLQRHVITSRLVRDTFTTTLYIIGQTQRGPNVTSLVARSSRDRCARHLRRIRGCDAHPA